MLENEKVTPENEEGSNTGCPSVSFGKGGDGASTLSEVFCFASFGGVCGLSPGDLGLDSFEVSCFPKVLGLLSTCELGACVLISASVPPTLAAMAAASAQGFAFVVSSKSVRGQGVFAPLSTD